MPAEQSLACSVGGAGLPRVTQGYLGGALLRVIPRTSQAGAGLRAWGRGKLRAIKDRKRATKDNTPYTRKRVNKWSRPREADVKNSISECVSDLDDCIAYSYLSHLERLSGEELWTGQWRSGRVDARD